MSASAGRVLIMPKDLWDSSTTYNMLDVITYQGKPYIAKITSTNQVPVGGSQDAYWMLLVDSKSSALEIDSEGYVAIDYDILG